MIINLHACSSSYERVKLVNNRIGYAIYCYEDLEKCREQSNDICSPYKIHNQGEVARIQDKYSHYTKYEILIEMNQSKEPISIVPIRRFKRIFDLLFITIISASLVPLFTFISLFYHISMIFYPEDRGTLFYSEWRYSRGKKFRLIKFRTIKLSILKPLIQTEKKNIFVKKHKMSLIA